ncbi:hypothetical protein TNCV_1735431 [Trichonephila clavipes]|nr:hypothetical protein TNCV_1735431 [Trichonephila clavipes]
MTALSINHLQKMKIELASVSGEAIRIPSVGLSGKGQDGLQLSLRSLRSIHYDFSVTDPKKRMISACHLAKRSVEFRYQN